ERHEKDGTHMPSAKPRTGRNAVLKRHTAAGAIAALLLPSAQAEAARPAEVQNRDDSEHVLIVVTGTATPVEYEKIGNTLTVIGGEAIEARGTAYLQDVLREVPGVAVNQGGSFG